MAPPPTVSPVTGNPVPPYYLHADAVHFRDTKGRSVLLRGVNLSGAAKNPPGQPSESQVDFWEGGESGKVSWVNSTLDLDDGSADVHLARLKAWGYNMLRFVFTWEALEHEGPGIYDYEYMDYVIKVLYKCKEYGFRVNMDPHQDVWSRFTGGSGAPYWTIYACGVDPLNVVKTHAAIVHCDYPSKEKPDPESIVGMIWSSNYYRAFGHTVWTLFFAGRMFAPKCTINGVNIQDFLQSHYINAVCELVKRVAAADGLFEECVLGWDSINEPGEGLIRIRDLAVIPEHQPVRLGSVPTPFENMRLAMGEAIEVPYYNFGAMGPYKNGTVVLDPEGTKLWLSKEADRERGAGRWGWKRGPEWEVGECIWAQHGVWDSKTSTLLVPDYFVTPPTNPRHTVSFVEDFWKEHWLAYGAAIRKYHPEAVHFMNTTVFKPLPKGIPHSALSGRACSTPHYYDGLTLMTKHWNWFNADALGLLRGKYWTVVQGLRIGEAAIRKSIQEQLGVMKQDTLDSIGEYPTMMGEIGIPYDMDDRRAYGFSDGGKGKGDYSSQQKALDCSMNAMDGPNVLDFTLWTYVPQQSHQWGDHWNGEDLSLWSPDDSQHTTTTYDKLAVGIEGNGVSRTLLATSSMSSSATLLPLPRVSPKGIESGLEVSPQLILDGARAPAAFCRPYPVATVGEPERMDFDIASTAFRLKVHVRPDDVRGVTEIYVPFVHYAKELDWEVTSADSSRQSSQLSLVSDDGTPILTKNGNRPLELDIDVCASAGSWTTSGQYLYWTYPIPPRATTYTIEIQRNGGALAVNMLNSDGKWWETLEQLGCTIA